MGGTYVPAAFMNVIRVQRSYLLFAIQSDHLLMFTL